MISTTLSTFRTSERSCASVEVFDFFLVHSENRRGTRTLSRCHPFRGTPLHKVDVHLSAAGIYEGAALLKTGDLLHLLEKKANRRRKTRCERTCGKCVCVGGWTDHIHLSPQAGLFCSSALRANSSARLFRSGCGSAACSPSADHVAGRGKRPTVVYRLRTATPLVALRLFFLSHTLSLFRDLS